MAEDAWQPIGSERETSQVGSITPRLDRWSLDALLWAIHKRLEEFLCGLASGGLSLPHELSERKSGMNPEYLWRESYIHQYQRKLGCRCPQVESVLEMRELSMYNCSEEHLGEKLPHCPGRLGTLMADFQKNPRGEAD